MAKVFIDLGNNRLALPVFTTFTLSLQLPCFFSQVRYTIKHIYYCEVIDFGLNRLVLSIFSQVVVVILKFELLSKSYETLFSTEIFFTRASQVFDETVKSTLKKERKSSSRPQSKRRRRNRSSQKIFSSLTRTKQIWNWYDYCPSIATNTTHTHTWRPPVWPVGLIVFSILATFSDQTLQNSIFFVKVGAKLCPKQNKPSINCQSLRRFRQSCKISPNRVTLSRTPTISSNKLCTLAICRTDSLCHHALLPPLTLYTHSFRVTRILPYSLSLPPFASPHSITNSPSLSLSLCKPTLYDKFTLSHTQSYFKLFISLSLSLSLSQSFSRVSLIEI